MRNPNCQYDWYRSMFEGPPRTTDAFVREMEGKVRSQRRALAQRRGEDAYQAQVVATGQAQRCPLCRTPFPEVVAAAARGSSTELATRETADLRPGMNVEVQWELDGAPTWYRAKLVRHLGPHSRHTTINPNE